MMRALCLLLLLQAGCARRAPVDAQPRDEPKAAGHPAEVGHAESGTQSSESPADLGDRVVARATAPDIPALPPIERFGTAPMPRAPSAWLVDPDSTPRAKLTPPPFIASNPIAARPAPPAERVPPDLGAGARAVPAKPKLPVAAAATKRSRDVNLPPPLPPLGRPAGDRASLEDPTTEFSAAVITTPPLKISFVPAPFLKVTVPDPFELGEQIRPAIPSAAEPAPMPVSVNPRRLK
jgi:hypothetical protein